jgi:hypothetical protein
LRAIGSANFLSDCIGSSTSTAELVQTGFTAIQLSCAALCLKMVGYSDNEDPNKQHVAIFGEYLN